MNINHMLLEMQLSAIFVSGRCLSCCLECVACHCGCKEQMHDKNKPQGTGDFSQHGVRDANICPGTAAFELGVLTAAA